MTRADEHQIANMLMAPDEIAQVVTRGRPGFDGDVVLRRAVERCLEVFGEASKSVSVPLAAAHPEIPWSDMARVRDRLSHHLDRIDPSQLWVMATVEIPAMAEQLRDLRIQDDDG